MFEIKIKNEHILFVTEMTNVKPEEHKALGSIPDAPKTSDLDPLPSALVIFHPRVHKYLGSVS